MEFFDAEVDFVAGEVGELQVEEDEVEFLFFGAGDGFGAAADDDAAEAGFFEELFEDGLEGGVVVDDEDGGLAGALGFEDIAVDEAAFDAPAAADLDGGELAALDEVVDGGEGDAEVFGGFLNGHQFVRFIGHNFQNSVKTERRSVRRGCRGEEQWRTRTPV